MNAAAPAAPAMNWRRETVELGTEAHSSSVQQACRGRRLFFRAKDSDEIHSVLEETILFGEPVHVGTRGCLIQQAKHRCREKPARVVHPITLSLDAGAFVVARHQPAR